MLAATDPHWYKKIWRLDTLKTATWVEQTKQEIDFLMEVLQLTGKERVLDLACGFGRHALELARRGHSVVGVDITAEYVEDARQQARSEHLDAQFICADLREMSFTEEFEVVLNLGDGAIGYLETDEENLKVFDLIAAALKPSGKHLLAVCNAAYAKKHFPRRFWQIGNSSILLAEFDWDAKTSRNSYLGHTLKYGETLTMPENKGPESSTRLYTLEELREILRARGIEIQQAYGSYHTAIPPSEEQFQLIVYSQKK